MLTRLIAFAGKTAEREIKLVVRLDAADLKLSVADGKQGWQSRCHRSAAVNSWAVIEHDRAVVVGDFDLRVFFNDDFAVRLPDVGVVGDSEVTVRACSNCHFIRLEKRLPVVVLMECRDAEFHCGAGTNGSSLRVVLFSESVGFKLNAALQILKGSLLPMTTFSQGSRFADQ